MRQSFEDSANKVMFKGCGPDAIENNNMIFITHHSISSWVVNKGNAKHGISPRLKISPGDLDLWHWKSIGFQILLRTKYVPCLIKIHWRMLILECSQWCHGRTDGSVTISLRNFVVQGIIKHVIFYNFHQYFIWNFVKLQNVSVKKKFGTVVILRKMFIQKVFLEGISFKIMYLYSQDYETKRMQQLYQPFWILYRQHSEG